MSIGILLILIILAFVCWTLTSSEDWSAVALILAAISIIQIALMWPEHVGTAVIAAGIATFIGLFAGAGLMIGNWFARSQKKEE